ncbi:hypothetical protein M1734_23820, partial [Salmonella enterica subsp. enterica serovar Yoruba]|nr:hypothetical protein [Salmonella enterica subsp. enterica serovar Yoruba]
MYDNTSGSDITYGATNYPIVKNSVFVSAAGGEPADVAYAIWQKKSLGCSYNGNTSYTVLDKNGYEAPYPEYVVT